jgi:predicted Na+-dependent transporter
VLALSVKPFFSSIIFAGAVLALCCPSAVVSSFWTKVFNGDVSTALVMSVVTNLLSIITIPATMLIAVGSSLNVYVSPLAMIERLAEIILIPMSASFLLRRFVHINWARTNSYGSKIELAVLVLIIWGSIAPGAAIVESNVVQFVLLNLFMILILSTAFGLTHLATIRFGHNKAIAIEISTIVKNAALSLVVAQAAFTSVQYPLALPPLIANLIAQNLLLIPTKAVTEKIATNVARVHEQSHESEHSHP